MWKKIRCPNTNCEHSKTKGVMQNFTRNGVYKRKVDKRCFQRYQCKACKLSFSAQSFSYTYKLQKPKHLIPLSKLLYSGVSLRRSAKKLKVNKKTTVRHFLRLGGELSKRNKKLIKTCGPFNHIFLDELITKEQTKLKPLTVPVAVSSLRLIIAYDVGSIPASGRLADISLRKYGKRKDESAKKFKSVLRQIKPLMASNCTMITDQKIDYIEHIRKITPNVEHISFKGGKPSTFTGQGELREKGFDPLFKINHTFAKLREDTSRLRRKTWCISKKAERLLIHLAIHSYWHNREILGYPL